MFRRPKNDRRLAIKSGRAKDKSERRPGCMQRHGRLFGLACEGVAELRCHALGDVHNRFSSHRQLTLRQRIGPHRCKQRRDDKQLRNGATTIQYRKYSFSSDRVKQALP